MIDIAASLVAMVPVIGAVAVTHVLTATLSVSWILAAAMAAYLC
jgi:hypothetical protein